MPTLRLIYEADYLKRVRRGIAALMPSATASQVADAIASGFGQGVAARLSVDLKAARERRRVAATDLAVAAESPRPFDLEAFFARLEAFGLELPGRMAGRLVRELQTGGVSGKATPRVGRRRTKEPARSMAPAGDGTVADYFASFEERAEEDEEYEEDEEDEDEDEDEEDEDATGGGREVVGHLRWQGGRASVHLSARFRRDWSFTQDDLINDWLTPLLWLSARRPSPPPAKLPGRGPMAELTMGWDDGDIHPTPRIELLTAEQVGWLASEWSRQLEAYEVPEPRGSELRMLLDVSSGRARGGSGP